MFTKLSAGIATMATAGALTVGALAVAPAAMASGNCDPGIYTRVASHKSQFQNVESVRYTNHTGTKFTGDFTVSKAHTSTWTKSASVTASVEASFFSFAKATASATAGISLAKSLTMTTTYGGHVTVPAHQTYQIDFGFLRYAQYVQKYHLVQQSGRCVIHQDAGGWITAPYVKQFVARKV